MEQKNLLDGLKAREGEAKVWYRAEGKWGRSFDYPFSISESEDEIKQQFVLIANKQVGDREILIDDIKLLPIYGDPDFPANLFARRA